jgi:hypothetical protein
MSGTKALHVLGQYFGGDLVKAGVIPPETKRFELIVGVNEVVKIKVESYITQTQYAAIAAQILEQPERIVRELLLTPVIDGKVVEGLAPLRVSV